MNSGAGGDSGGDGGIVWGGGAQGQGQGRRQQQQQQLQPELDQLQQYQQQLILQQQLQLQLQHQQQQQYHPRTYPPQQDNISSSSSGLLMNAGGGIDTVDPTNTSDSTESNWSSLLGYFFSPQQQQQQQQQQPLQQWQQSQEKQQPPMSSIHPPPETVQSVVQENWPTMSSSNQQGSLYEPRPLLNDLNRLNSTNIGNTAGNDLAITSLTSNRGISSGSSVSRKRTNRNDSRKGKHRKTVRDHVGSSKGSQMENIKNLADDLNQLSVEQRTQIMDEIHGVDKIDMPVETPEFVNQKLKELQNELSKLNPRRQRKHYDRAVFLKPSIVDDFPFQLMFLRATRYDANKAAIMMASYFTNKVQLFGMSKIVEPITVHDLSPEDHATFETNATRALPEKDSVGRLVVWSILPEFRGRDWKNVARGYWYELMRNIQDDEQVQLNGGVKVFFFYPLTDTDGDGNEVPCKGPNLLDPAFAEIASKCGPILNDLPLRFNGVHMCYDNVQLNPLINIIQILIGRENRLRLRAHQGSRMESQCALMQFGIPLKDAPMFEKLSDFRKYNHRYLEDRRRLESPKKRLPAETSNTTDEQNIPLDLDRNIKATASPHPTATSETEIILYPSEYDVLLGRGRPYQDYSGNQYLTKLVDVIRHCYLETNDRHEKRYLGMSVMAQIESKGGRFLKRAESSPSSPQSEENEEDGEQNKSKGGDGNKTSMTTVVPASTVVKGWQVVSSDTALDKILHAFRTKKTTA